jgi:hypothetical protein
MVELTAQMARDIPSPRGTLEVRLKSKRFRAVENRIFEFLGFDFFFRKFNESRCTRRRRRRCLGGQRRLSGTSTQQQRIEGYDREKYAEHVVLNRVRAVGASAREAEFGRAQLKHGGTEITKGTKTDGRLRLFFGDSCRFV